MNTLTHPHVHVHIVFLQKLHASRHFINLSVPLLRGDSRVPLHRRPTIQVLIYQPFVTTNKPTMDVLAQTSLCTLQHYL